MTYLDVDDEPAIGSIVTEAGGIDRWERDVEGWWLLGPAGREAPTERPAQWDQLLDMCGLLRIVKR